LSVEPPPADVLRRPTAGLGASASADGIFLAGRGSNLWKAGALAGKLATNRGLADLINVL
jgi:hypothetical protein